MLFNLATLQFVLNLEIVSLFHHIARHFWLYLVTTELIMWKSRKSNTSKKTYICILSLQRGSRGFNVTYDFNHLLEELFYGCASYLICFIQKKVVFQTKGKEHRLEVESRLSLERGRGVRVGPGCSACRSVPRRKSSADFASL